jgi:hypothetical protein
VLVAGLIAGGSQSYDGKDIVGNTIGAEAHAKVQQY